MHQWAAGESAPDEQAQRRMRLALDIVLLIAQVDSPSVAQAWFQGANPRLDDSAPARFLRDGDLIDVANAFVAAGRAFFLKAEHDPKPQVPQS